MSMMGELTYFLRLQVKQLKHGTFLSQTKYYFDLLKKFKMEDCKEVATPIATIALWMQMKLDNKLIQPNIEG